MYTNKTCIMADSDEIGGMSAAGLPFYKATALLKLESDTHSSLDILYKQMKVLFIHTATTSISPDTSTCDFRHVARSRVFLSPSDSSSVIYLM